MLSKRINFSWYVIAFLFAILLTLPILYIAFGLLLPADDTWRHLSTYLLPNYLYNTSIILIGIGFISLLLGIPTAWLVSAYRFPMQKTLSWLLILPLAIPAYINAYTYKALCSKGLFYTWFGVYIDVMNLQGAILVIASVLYPYIFLIARSSFENIPQSLIEASQLLGKSKYYTFFHIILPIARPAMIGGLVLVLMEGLNEYGTFKYYSIQTFSTGIFRAWFAMDSIASAIRLAACLLVFVFTLLSIEKWQSRKLRFSNAQTQKPLRKQQLKGWKAVLAILVCLVPCMLGFGIPILQLLHWASQIWKEVNLPNFTTLISNSLLLASISAIVVVIPALLLNYVQRISPQLWVQTTVRIASLGYAIPGAIIAIGTMATLLVIDRWLSTVFALKLSNLWLSGTTGGLIYAYSVRFFSVASQPIAARWQQISPNMDNASWLLGKNRLKTFFLLHLPLLKGSLAAAMLLVIVDVLKELPLTLILRPFNFDTLATTAFEFADDERLVSASISSLLIILVGLLPVIGLNKLLKN
jgi:iron(III) transport system permease protein